VTGSIIFFGNTIISQESAENDISFVGGLNSKLDLEANG
jgi:hypothetical protein